MNLIHTFFQGSINAIEKWLKMHYLRIAWAMDQTSPEHVHTYYKLVCERTGGILFNARSKLYWREIVRRRGETPEVMWDVLVNEGFDAYTQATHPIISNYRAEAIEALRKLASAENPEEQMEACLWLIRLPHHAGNIVSDYGGDWETLNAIRTGGLNSVFARELIEKTLAELHQYKIDLLLLEYIDDQYPLEV
jgi:hypothetical protein